MSLMNLFRPHGGTTLRAPCEHEVKSIASALLHIPTPRLAQIADNDLSPLVGDAIQKGGGILQIGLAPSDLEIAGNRFAARCDLRLTTTRTRLEIRMEGVIDEKGRVAPDMATLIARAA